MHNFDVIDDYYSEAKEVLDAGNNFLVYTLDLHICRMAGCYNTISDLLDEEKLNPYFSYALTN